MSPQFRAARDLLGLAAARAVCADAGADMRTSWYIAQVGLGVPRRRLADLLRVDKSKVGRVVRAIEEAREAPAVDRRLTRLERHARGRAG